MASLFLEFLENQYKDLKESGQVFNNAPSRDRVAVIVEPRRCDLLLRVIRNVMYFVGDNWNLHIFTCRENTMWIENELKGCSFRITPLEKTDLTRDEYSLLLMNEDFWNMIPEENILIFQMDTMLFRKGIDEWVDENYDYVGANYYNPEHTCFWIGGIQGGLSLRKRSAMIKCIKKIKPHDIQAYRDLHGLKPLKEKTIAEDIYFTHACEILEMRTPPQFKRKKFSIEADYDPETLGHHGTTRRYFTEAQQRLLLTTANLI